MKSPATIALLPLSALYGVVVQARNALYHQEIFRSHKIDAPVISVGNLTMGGTGKTPLVEWIAKELAGRDRRVCVLTRGYGRSTKGRVIVSDGERIVVDVDQAGDEALLLAESLHSQAVVICDADRVAAAQFAIKSFGTDAFVLDDAFQHQRIVRDLNIVTIDAMNPWENGHLIPAGSLREPRKSLRRADCVVITRSDQSNDLETLLRQVREIRSDLPVFRSRMKLTNLRPLDRNTDAFSASLPLAAFCGIANPISFFKLLGNDYQLTLEQSFHDHHTYTQHEIDRFIADGGARGAAGIVTTAKDAVKLRKLKFDLPCYVAEIAIEIDREDEFRRLILSAITN